MRLFLTYWWLNLRILSEYRFTLGMQVLSTVLNNTTWLLFWGIFFQRFANIQGWTMTDMIALWSIVAAGFGLFNGLCGGALRIPSLIELAGLDTYLTYPRSVLPHVLVSRANAFAWADFGWGVAVFLLFYPRSLAGTGVFLVSVLCVTMILCGLMVLVGALGFWILRSQVVSEQVMTAMIHFATWPQSIYRPEIRILLCTLLPAVLIGSVPVNLVRSFSWGMLGLLAGAGVVFLVLGSLVFRLGLRRYESGNRIMMMG